MYRAAMRFSLIKFDNSIEALPKTDRMDGNDDDDESWELDEIVTTEEGAFGSELLFDSGNHSALAVDVVDDGTTAVASA
jgi:hypothetical protein